MYVHLLKKKPTICTIHMQANCSLIYINNLNIVKIPIKSYINFSDLMVDTYFRLLQNKDTYLCFPSTL